MVLVLFCMNKRGLIGSVVVIGVLLVVGFFWFVGEIDSEGIVIVENDDSETIEAPVQMANPASTYCIGQGYDLDVRSGEGGEYGVCVFGNGKECEEWAFFRGECRADGLERCVAASCCHAKSCAWESEVPDCSGSICTMSCEPGTMDCGAGECGVVEGECGVVWNG